MTWATDGAALGSSGGVADGALGCDTSTMMRRPLMGLTSGTGVDGPVAGAGAAASMAETMDALGFFGPDMDASMSRSRW